MISYSLVRDTHGESLTIVYSDGETSVVPSTHPKFSAVRDLVLDPDTSLKDLDEDKIRNMLDIVTSVGSRLKSLSDRVRVSGNKILFDGDILDNTLADHILRLIENDDDNGYRPLVNFLEKVQTNPSERSRESLYSWLKDRSFTITPDGDFLAYKGVKVEDGVSLSIHSGKAFVNGEVIEGYIPNPVGAVIEMPRSKVQENTSIGCSTGLHAGTWGYASGFSRGRILTVSINPRDVVSVPTDCDAQKLRVSRYVVLNETTESYTQPTYYESSDYDEEDDDYYEEDDVWGDGEDEYEEY